MAITVAVGVVLGAACSDDEPTVVTTTTRAAPSVTDVEAITRDLGVEPLAPAGAFGAVWVLGNAGDVEAVRAPVVVRLDPATGDTELVDLGIEATPQPDPPVPAAGGVTADALHVFALVDRTLVRIDPATDRVDARWTLPEGVPCCLAADTGVVWVLQDTDEAGVLTRVDTTTGTVTPFPAPRGLKNLAAGDDSVWVTDVDGNRVIRRAAGDGRVLATIPVRPRPAQVSVGLGGVWVTSQAAGALERIDPSSNEVEATVDLNLGPDFADTVEAFGLTIADDALFVALRRIDDDADLIARVEPGGSVVDMWRFASGYTHEFAVVDGAAYTTVPFSQLYWDADELPPDRPVEPGPSGFMPLLEVPLD